MTEKAIEVQRPVGSAAGAEVIIRPLAARDLDAADRIVRLAFGRFFGVPEPEAEAGDSDYVRTRYRANPEAAFGAEVGGDLVGSNFAANWGSVGFFGPLTVHPDYWGRGIGRHLIEPAVDLFEHWGVRQAGLCTFANSPKHIALYQKFGFWPRFLTAFMSKPVDQGAKSLGAGPAWSRYSGVPEGERAACLRACGGLTDAIYEGLDVRSEISSVEAQKLGDTVLLWDDSQLAGLAVCHSGAGSEAGSGKCYMKFAAVRPGPDSARAFDRLLDSCEALAVELGASSLEGGVNTARHEAYRQMLARGFVTSGTNIIMQRPNEAGYNRPGVYLIDDWR